MWTRFRASSRETGRPLNERSRGHGVTWTADGGKQLDQAARPRTTPMLRHLCASPRSVLGSPPEAANIELYLVTACMIFMTEGGIATGQAVFGLGVRAHSMLFTLPNVLMPYAIYRWITQIARIRALPHDYLDTRVAVLPARRRCEIGQSSLPRTTMACIGSAPPRGVRCGTGDTS